MDPYSSYTQATNFDSISTGSRSSVVLEPPPILPQQAPQQQLPSFSEILQSQDMAPHDHYSNQHLHHGQQDETRPYPGSAGVRRTGQPSPESQPGTSTEGFDNMSSRSVDGSYPDPRHHRQSSSWASNSQFSDVLSPPYSQRLQYPRTSLPPIRDVAHSFDHNYHSEPAPYPQNYAQPAISQNGLDTSSYANDRPSFYDATQRYGQNCPQVNRPPPPAQIDYYRFPQPGTPYQAPSYPGIEYSTASMGVHHPSSPTVCGDTDSRNRRRRGNLPKPVTDILRGWFHEHLDHPYPTEEDKQAFAARTGLTINQISNWFINARRRHLPALRQARDRSTQMITTDYDSDQLRRTHVL